MKKAISFLLLLAVLAGCRPLDRPTAGTSSSAPITTVTTRGTSASHTSTTYGDTTTSVPATTAATTTTTTTTTTTAATTAATTTATTVTTTTVATTTAASRPSNPGTGIFYQGAGPVIAIDPGHQLRGNSEKEPNGPGSNVMKAKVMSGTYGRYTGLTEYELNLRVALALRDELIKRGYSVVMIRETHEVDISNAERSEIANSYEAAAFIRIHANGSDNSSVHGCETICQSRQNPYNGDLYAESHRLSSDVLDAFCAATGIGKRSVVESDTMTGINWCRTPVTIIEMGFMTNRADDEQMASPDFAAVAARGIADGIDKFLK